MFLLKLVVFYLWPPVFRRLDNLVLRASSYFNVNSLFRLENLYAEVRLCWQFAEPELQKLLCADMETRLVHLKSCLTSLKTESEEVWKTLETAERSLLAMLTAKDYDCSGYFGDNAVPAHKPPETVSIKLRADRHETEEFYLTVSIAESLWTNWGSS